MSITYMIVCSKIAGTRRLFCLPSSSYCSMLSRQMDPSEKAAVDKFKGTLCYQHVKAACDKYEGSKGEHSKNVQLKDDILDSCKENGWGKYMDLHCMELGGSPKNRIPKKCFNTTVCKHIVFGC